MMTIFVLLVIKILLVYGITNIVVYGSILNRPRNLLSKLPFFDDLLTCMMCSSFWIGGLSMFLFTPIVSYLGMIQLPLYLYMLVMFIMEGGLFSGTTWVIHTIQEWFERGNRKDTKEEIGSQSETLND